MGVVDNKKTTECLRLQPINYKQWFHNLTEGGKKKSIDNTSQSVFIPVLVLEGKRLPEVNLLVFWGEFWCHIHFHGKQIWRGRNKETFTYFFLQPEISLSPYKGSQSLPHREQHTLLSSVSSKLQQKLHF